MALTLKAHREEEVRKEMGMGTRTPSALISVIAYHYMN